VFFVDNPVEATFASLTITRGTSQFPGGGLLNRGRLTVIDTIFTSNSNAVGNGGTLTIDHSVIAGNLGESIYNQGGTLTVTHSTFSLNSGTYGGAIFNRLYSTATLIDSTFSDNSGSNGGAIDTESTLNILGCTFSGNIANIGGALHNYSGAVTVSNCTFSGNIATQGGAIYDYQGGLTVLGSTVTANSAWDTGGGIDIDPSIGGAHLQNDLVAGNTSVNGGPDAKGSMDRASAYNLIGVADSTLSGISDGVNHNQVGSTAHPVDALLGPLGTYGGPTRTVPLLPGSPALNAGDPAFLESPDQRGVTRTGGINIGAFQASASAFVITAPATVTAGVPFDVTVLVLDQFGQLAVGYTGTISFSTSDQDPGVVLPPDYTFQASDGGVVTFSSGVTLITPGQQTLTVTDLDNGITNSTSVAL
jgi:hypothetical protein